MKPKPRSGGEQPIGTRNSVKEAREVEEVVGIGAFYGDRDAMDIEDNNGVRMDVDEDEDEQGGSLSKMVKKKVAKKQGRKRMEEAEARTRVEDMMMMLLYSCHRRGLKGNKEKAKAKRRVDGEVAPVKMSSSKAKGNVRRLSDED
jgi:non-homologous end joining protein Ku